MYRLLFVPVRLTNGVVLSRQELGFPVFPADYPDTLSGQAHWERRSKRLLEKWMAHPPAKRCPFFAGAGSPFCPAAPLSAGPLCVRRSPGCASSLMPVSIQLTGRGSVGVRASIYSRDVSAAVAGRALDPDTAQRGSQVALAQWRSMQAATAGDDAPFAVEEHRVGVAFGGGTSMFRGIGFGVGLVHWNDQVAAAGGRVWLRNLNSKQCVCAIVRPLQGK